jgi:WD40 repeat protein
LRSRAVLIGTATYRSTELADLPSVANNLTALHDVLVDPALGGLQPGRCTVLADQTNVHEVYRTLLRNAEEATDTLLIYFAGHGLLEPHHNELCLALAGSDPADLPAGVLPFEWLRFAFLRSPATNRVLVLDCCYSGRATTAHLSDTEKSIFGQIDIEGTYILAAVGANQLALAPPHEQYTAFTGELLSLIQTGVPNGAELLTFATIYQHLLRRLPARGLPQPQQLNTGTADSLALTRNYQHNDAADQVGFPAEPRRTGRVPSASRITAIGTGNKVRSLTFSRDGRRLAAATGTNRVRVFDTRTWRQRIVVRQAWNDRASVHAVAYSPARDHLATGGGDADGGLVRLWDETRPKHDITYEATVLAIAFDPGGTWLATGDSSGNAQLWNVATKKRLTRVRHSEHVLSVAFSPDKRSFATGSGDRTARIWDVYTGMVEAVLPHDHGVAAVAFSPDGHLLASGSTSATIWDPRTGAQLRTLSPASAAQREGTSCNGVAFSPNGRLLAGAFADHTARIWDVHAGTELFSLGHDHEVHCVAFSPDGHVLATGDGRSKHLDGRGVGTIHLWRIAGA